MKKNDINIPKIHIDPDRLMKADVDITLMSSSDSFFRRIVEFVLNKVEGTEDGEILAILVDDNGKEYETCDLIKQLTQYLKDE